MGLGVNGFAVKEVWAGGLLNGFSAGMEGESPQHQLQGLD